MMFDAWTNTAFTTVYCRGGQTFCAEGHILKNVAAEGRTLSLQSRKIYPVCK